MRIPIVEHIMSANDRLAEENRALLDNAHVYALNIMASPGAGKTSLIEQTIRQLAGHLRVGVIEGDLATSIDAERAEAAGATALQINTGGNCHLDAAMLNEALKHFPFGKIDLLIVENVGNLICPANFHLGTHKSVLIASIPEGDDKPYKYPGMYHGVDVMVLNKIDLLPYVPFKLDYFQAGVETLNPGVRMFQTSCSTKEGIDGWIAWIQEQVHQYRIERVGSLA